MTFNSFKASVEFLTIFRVCKAREKTSPENFANSITYFPLVGILLGGICALVEFTLRDLIVSDLVRSLFPVILLAILSGGLHLDGVADCFDALRFAGHDKEKALKVMKGNTIGAFGASALIIVIAGKILSISALPEGYRIQSLILIPSLSRWTSSIVAREGAPASTEGLGYIFTVYSTKKAFLLSAVFALVFSLLLLGLKGVIIFAFVYVFSIFLILFFNRAYGGITGDVFGAVLELAEVFGFLIVGIITTI
ncbi:MAG: adenosylcobinamide-GDP ribazoletransferase [Candidatus Dadabacteria bacterium]|nr:adenosylcobinamide-GDP ribazoletransferase [Candidatus Dadabacteria bacterium]